MLKLTKEEFIKRVYENNEHVRNGDIEIFGEYNGLEKSIEYLCHKCNNIQNPIALSLLNGNGCRSCGRIRTAKSQRKSNTEFQRELCRLRDNGQDVFSDDEYINNHTKIYFYCSKGHTWDAVPASVLNGNGCPYCSNKRILIGYNDIFTTSPDIFKFLADKNDGYKYTRWSNQRVDFKCTLCGHVQNRKIGTVAHRGFRCECCGDGISYPNKFGRALFDQLPVKKYKSEYCPKWGAPYVYDIYFQLNDNEYTEKVLIENASEQTQAEFNEINQKYLTANDEWDKYAFPVALSSYFSAVFPAFTYLNYRLWVPKKKNDEDVADEEIDDEHIPQIDPEVMKMVMQIKDTPYQPINAKETHTAIPNIPRSIDACIIETEEQNNQEENQNTI